MSDHILNENRISSTIHAPDDVIYRSGHKL